MKIELFMNRQIY